MRPHKSQLLWYYWRFRNRKMAAHPRMRFHFLTSHSADHNLTRILQDFCPYSAQLKPLIMPVPLILPWMCVPLDYFINFLLQRWALLQQWAEPELKDEDEYSDGITLDNDFGSRVFFFPPICEYFCGSNFGK